MLEQVTEDIFRIRVPIPFPLRTVNVYALVGQDGGWTLVDTAMGTPEARAELEDGLQKAGLNIDRLRSIVLTHHHPDHVGLSGELQEQSGATVYMHPIDEKALQIIWSGTMPQRFNRVSHFFSDHGMPTTELWYIRTDPGAMREILRVPPHEAFTFVDDGQELELSGKPYRVIWVPGHSDGQICLFREQDGVMLAADHILPRITPNIGLYSEHDRLNPLGDYLASLAKVSSLPATLVLPGHGDPLHDLAGRVGELEAHHEDRLAVLTQMLSSRPQHAYELTMQMFGERLKNDEAKRMALAEVLSHLEYLRFQEKVEQHRTKDGLILYALV